MITSGDILLLRFIVQKLRLPVWNEINSYFGPVCSTRSAPRYLVRVTISSKPAISQAFLIYKLLFWFEIIGSGLSWPSYFCSISKACLINGIWIAPLVFFVRRCHLPFLISSQRKPSRSEKRWPVKQEKQNT